MQVDYPERVEEADLDYEAILTNGGENFGDEDFDVFKCPNCGQIYLLEYEVDTVYLDPEDLSKRVPVDSDSFDCTNCGIRLPYDDPWIGDKAGQRFHVSYRELRESRWAWILNGRRNPTA